MGQGRRRAKDEEGLVISLKLFTRPMCSGCEEAKARLARMAPDLEARGVEIEEFNIQTAEGLAELAYWATSGSILTVPIFIVAGPVGRSPALDSLDEALAEIERREEDGKQGGTRDDTAGDDQGGDL